MNDTYSTTDSKLASYTAIVLRPNTMTADDRAEMIETLLDLCWKFSRATGATVHHEPVGLGDMYEGRQPRSLWARAYCLMNENRSSDEPMREPGEDHIKAFKLFWGGVIVEACLVMLIEAPTVGPEFDRLMEALGKLPARAVVSCEVTAASRKNRNSLNPF